MYCELVFTILSKLGYQGWHGGKIGRAMVTVTASRSIYEGSKGQATSIEPLVTAAALRPTRLSGETPLPRH